MGEKKEGPEWERQRGEYGNEGMAGEEGGRGGHGSSWPIVKEIVQH